MTEMRKIYKVTVAEKAPKSIHPLLSNEHKTYVQEHYLDLENVPGFLADLTDDYEAKVEPYMEIEKKCQNCGCNTLVEITGKTSDLCFHKHRHREHVGYVLRGMGIGEDVYLKFTFCTHCGQIQGEWPRPIHGAIVTRDTDGYADGEHKMDSY